VKRRRLGRSGISVSEIGLGTMTFGSMVDEHLAAASAVIPDGILVACDEIWKEIRYPME